MTASTSMVEILKALQAEAAANPEVPVVARSFPEYRWFLDHAFSGYAPRACETQDNPDALYR